jgi:hypothetical protein
MALSYGAASLAFRGLAVCMLALLVPAAVLEHGGWGFFDRGFGLA